MTTEIALSDIDLWTLVESIEAPRLSIPFSVIQALDGDIGAAAFLCQAAFLSAKKRAGEEKSEGWFDLVQVGQPHENAKSLFQKMGSWQAVTGLNPDAQALARRKLKARGLLEEKLKGVPARLHYRVLPGVYLVILAGRPVSEISETRFGKTGKLDSGKPGNKNRKNRETIPESTPESAPESKTPSLTRVPRAGAGASPAGEWGELLETKGWNGRDARRLEDAVARHGEEMVKQQARDMQTAAGGRPFVSELIETLRRLHGHSNTPSPPGRRGAGQPAGGTPARESGHALLAKLARGEVQP